jgi:hypothetical protein
LHKGREVTGPNAVARDPAIDAGRFGFVGLVQAKDKKDFHPVTFLTVS